MQNTIWKYPLGQTGTASGKKTVQMPKGSTVLSAVNQYNMPTVYALVDDTVKETETHTFDVCLTGGDVDHDASFTFLDTVMLDERTYVYHVFHKKP